MAAAGIFTVTALYMTQSAGIKSKRVVVLQKRTGNLVTLENEALSRAVALKRAVTQGSVTIDNSLTATYCQNPPAETLISCAKSGSNVILTLKETGNDFPQSATVQISGLSVPPCTNGANNPPTCNTCPAPLVLVSGACACPTGTSLVSGACVCTNGATNPPTCNTCPSPRVLVSGACACPTGTSLVSGACVCTNGATNPPTCTPPCRATISCSYGCIGIVAASCTYRSCSNTTVILYRNNVLGLNNFLAYEGLTCGQTLTGSACELRCSSCP
jgi:hypothetical protein